MAFFVKLRVFIFHIHFTIEWWSGMVFESSNENSEKKIYHLGWISTVPCGGVCGRAVGTSNSGSGGPGFKLRPSRCFLTQETLLLFVSLYPGV